MIRHLTVGAPIQRRSLCGEQLGDDTASVKKCNCTHCLASLDIMLEAGLVYRIGGRGLVHVKAKAWPYAPAAPDSLTYILKALWSPGVLERLVYADNPFLHLVR